MKTIKLLCLLLVTCLAVTHQAQSQAVSALPLLTSPATNDFWNLLDVSDTTKGAAGSQKKVPVHSFFDLFAATNLPYLTTTGRITINAGNSFASKFLLKTPNDSTAGSLEIGNADQSWGYTFTKSGVGGGFDQDLLITSTKHGKNIIRAGTNGWVKINDTTAPASALDVNGTVTATQFSGSGAGLTSIPAGQLTGTVPSGVYDQARTTTTRQTFGATSGTQNNHGNQSSAVTAQLSTNAHKITLTGDATITIGGTAPAAPSRTVLEFELVQDGTGGRTPAFSPTPANGQPVIDETASAVTVVYLRTSDGGSTWQAFSSYDSGGGTGNDQGVRSEFIPAGWMGHVTGDSAFFVVNTTSGNGIVPTRLFNDPETTQLSFSWQRPRDAVDAVAGGDFQLKWRWVGVAPAAGLSSDTIALNLSAVGKATGDSICTTPHSIARVANSRRKSW